MIDSIQIIAYSGFTLLIVLSMIALFLFFPTSKPPSKREVLAWRTAIKGMVFVVWFFMLANMGLIIYWIAEAFSPTSEGLNLGAIVANYIAIFFFMAVLEREKSSILNKIAL